MKMKTDIHFDKDAFVGVQKIDGIECKILFVTPSLRLFAWRLDKPELVVFGLTEKEDFVVNPEEAGFNLDENGCWVKPNGDSVVVFFDRDISFGEYDRLFEKYFPREYEINRKTQEEGLRINYFDDNA